MTPTQTGCADLLIESKPSVKRKPDTLVVLMALFGLGVVATLLLPVTSNSTVAAPASPLQAGIIIQD